MVTVLYNLILSAFDLIALERIRRSKTLAAWSSTIFAAIIFEVVTATVFARNVFDLFRLTAYVVFLHGFVLMAGSAVIFRRAKKGLSLFLGIGSAGLALLACYAFLIEPFWLEVSYLQIADKKIDGPIRIVFLADLQTDRFGDYERSVLRRVMQEKPDLILLGGDYLHASSEQFQPLCREINEFLHESHFSAPLGIYAVEGNIDSPDWQEIFAGLDVNAVISQKSFDLGAVQLTCLGLDESFDTAGKITNPQPDKYHIVLGHSPNYALGEVKADLLLAGHTHGGQIRLPLLGPILKLSKVPRSWAAGLTMLPNKPALKGTVPFSLTRKLGQSPKLLVSRGIGMERGSAPRLRFFCRPQLVVIDLMPEMSAKY